MKPGEEMLRAAVLAAKELGIPFTLCDRNIQITLRRAWGQTRLWGKIKMLSVMIASALTNEKLEAEEIEKLKGADLLQTMMQEVADYLPAAKHALIDERDRYLATRILEAEGERVVAVEAPAISQGSPRISPRGNRRTPLPWIRYPSRSGQARSFPG